MFMVYCLGALLFLVTGCAASSGTAPAADRSKASPAAVSAFDGEVIGVDRTPPGNSLSSNVRLVLRPGSSEPVTVELAPGWYLEEQGVQLSAAQRIRGRGRQSKTADGGRAMVAWEIHTDERVIPLRDERGHPVWRQAAP